MNMASPSTGSKHETDETINFVSVCIYIICLDDTMVHTVHAVPHNHPT